MKQKLVNSSFERLRSRSMRTIGISNHRAQNTSTGALSVAGVSDLMMQWRFFSHLDGNLPITRQVEGGDKIGALELWIGKRMVEAGQLNSLMGWEWEHGYRQGVKDFEKVIYT